MSDLYLASILLLIASTAAAAADCGNCGGTRIVGSGPVRWACPVCDGTGASAEPADSEPDSALSPAAAGRPRPVVARITAADGPSRISGSGVLVESGHSGGMVLTNWHVVRTHRNGLTVSWPDGSSSAGRVIAYDEAWDLAAVAVDRPSAKPVAISATAPRLGDQITIAGYGPDGTYLEQTGAVTEYLSPTRAHARQFVEIRATARQGDSGGPMFSADGELSGVLFGASKGRTVGSCSTRLRAFLAETKSGKASSTTVSAEQCCDGRCAAR